MERRHGPRPYSALEPISHHKIVPFSQLSYESIELRKVVGIISVTHNHETAFCCFDSAGKRCSVTTFRNRYDARAKTLRHGLGTVSRAIVGNQYFTTNLRS